MHLLLPLEGHRFLPQQDHTLSLRKSHRLLLMHDDHSLLQRSHDHALLLQQIQR
jgi:hypothetical protein